MIKLTLMQLLGIAHAAEAILGDECWAFIELCEDSLDQIAITMGVENTNTDEGGSAWRYERGKLFIPKLR